LGLALGLVVVAALLVVRLNLLAPVRRVARPLHRTEEV